MKAPEVGASHNRKLKLGFYDKFMQGNGLDIGWKGSELTTETVLPTAIGIDLDTPNYDGLHLPVKTESQDYIYSSHSLEHFSDYKATLREWYRVLKIDGYMILILPHKFLFEKKEDLPSVLNLDHKRFYTPASLLKEIEESLVPNSYRIRYLCDNDDNFNYEASPDVNNGGRYEIECVIQKIKTPTWRLRK